MGASQFVDMRVIDKTVDANIVSFSMRPVSNHAIEDDESAARAMKDVVFAEIPMDQHNVTVLQCQNADGTPRLRAMSHAGILDAYDSWMNGAGKVDIRTPFNKCRFTKTTVETLQKRGIRDVEHLCAISEQVLVGLFGERETPNILVEARAVLERERRDLERKQRSNEIESRDEQLRAKDKELKTMESLLRKVQEETSARIAALEELVVNRSVESADEKATKAFAKKSDPPGSESVVDPAPLELK